MLKTDMEIEIIISKYVSGNPTTEKEKEQLLHWLEQSEENRRQFRDACDIWLAGGDASAEDIHTERALARLMDRIGSASAAEKIARCGPVPRMWRLLRVAAAIALPLACIYAGYRWHDAREATETVVVNKAMTHNRSKARFVLPDSTVVWLNSNSVLEYPDAFTGPKRVVRLHGEALFDVKKANDFPFIVQVDEIDVEVLGTRFVVQNYPDKPIIETVLVEGSVKIGGSGITDPTILTPGQLLSLDKQSNTTDVRSVDSSNYTSWINSQLVFDNSNLGDIITNLQKWYGIDIVVTRCLLEETSLSFTVNNEPPEEILKYMSLTIPAKLEFREGKYYLAPYS